MQRVLVTDKNKQPLMPCHPAWAREVPHKGKAAVYRTFPFTIILKEREGYRLRQKRHFGFQTGDMVKAIVPAGKVVGTHSGRVACRATGSFDISTSLGKAAGVSHRHCRVLHHSDGYTYKKGQGAIPPHA